MARPKGTKQITPERMLELFMAYKKQVKSKPFLIKDWVGKDAFEVQREKEKPLTMEGFEMYVFEQGLNGELSHYFANYNNSYEDYLAICSRIKKAIREDQIAGGMAGIYNPSITQRLNGLAEKADINVSSNVNTINLADGTEITI